MGTPSVFILGLCLAVVFVVAWLAVVDYEKKATTKARPASLARLGWFGALAAVVLWLIWALVVVDAFRGYWFEGRADGATTQTRIEQLGQVGDIFGGVNALFAAFAFVGVAIAAYYQHRTFVLQQEQSVRQAFEPLFFKLLDRHKVPETLLVHGREWAMKAAVDWLRKDLDGVFREQRQQGHDLAGLGALVNIGAHWNVFYHENEGTLAPYFRGLYHVFKLIARSDLSWQEKVDYANIARASLNSDELLLLALNCKDRSDFKPFVVGFGLLKHVRRRTHPDEILPEQVLLDACYGETADKDQATREQYWRDHPEECPEWGPKKG